VADVADRARGFKERPSREELDRRAAEHLAELENPRDVSAEDRDRFVGYVSDHPECSLREACGEVGIRRLDVKALRETDAEFEEDYRNARGWGPEQIVHSLRKLGIEGVLEPLVSAGKLVKDDDGEVVYVRKFSDRAAIALFNAMTPEGKAAAAGRFGVEVSGAQVQVKVQAGVPLSDVFEFMRQHVGAAALPPGDEIAGELVAETDEPAP
jgi:hypothetical protein